MPKKSYLVSVFLVLAQVFFTYNAFSQTDDFEVMAYHEFIDLAKDTGDHLILKNVFIKVNSKDVSYGVNPFTDIEIHKEVILINVVFSLPIKISNFTFHEIVILRNSLLPQFVESTFHKGLIIENSIQEQDDIDYEKHLLSVLNEDAFLNQGHFVFNNCRFNGLFQIDISNPEIKHFSFIGNTLSLEPEKEGSNWYPRSGTMLSVNISNLTTLDFSKNHIQIPDKIFNLNLHNNGRARIKGNKIITKYSKVDLENENLVNSLEINNRSVQARIFEENDIESLVFFYPFRFSRDDYFSWKDLQNKLFFISKSPSSYNNIVDISGESKTLKFESRYLDSLVKDEKLYNFTISSYAQFLDFYKLQHNQDWANLVFLNMKDIQTRRYKYLYLESKNFESYFKWWINRFLKIFSDYGTEPSKAIIISIYVIFIFAFFYLFFPNSWDQKNKHRIMNRMLFFTKYFKRREGMKEVFEEEKKSQMMAYEDFRSFISESKNEIPPYFVSLSKPIYILSVANFKLRSKILSKADILKGRWVELNPQRKAITSIIMAFWLLGIFLYDLVVKFFNALMLSINTFSTLGFGEIPIKGIARYLAILQGFLGWFMLSIFSVSLISQLLN